MLKATRWLGEMMKISRRLIEIASMVPPGTRVADIGCDHALLAAYLAKEEIALHVIGVEVSEGPYRSACKTVSELEDGGKIEIRKGSGFKALLPGEVDNAVIAGMGGSTIIGILEENPVVTAGIGQLVLQPMNGEKNLRRWLTSHGWSICSESIVAEEERFYVVMAAKQGKSMELNELEAEYGPYLIKNRHPLLIKILEKSINSMQEIIEELEKSTGEGTRKKAVELHEKLVLAKGLKEWLYTVGE